MDTMAITKTSLGTGVIGELTHYGKNELMKSLNEILEPLDNGSVVRLAELDYNVGFIWQKPNSPRFTKRLRKYLYDRYGYKLPDYTTTEIGNLYNRYNDNGTQHNIDIIDDIDWYAGDFGDTGSCYWGENDDDRVSLELSDNAYAIRAYNDDNEGVGRAWVVEQDAGLVVFNGYHDNHAYPTLLFAQLLAQLTGLTIEKIDISSHIYVNGDTGYILCKSTDELPSYREYLQIEEYSSKVACTECGYSYPEDEMYNTDGGDDLCSDCAYGCEKCGLIVPDSEIVFYQNSHICDSCIQVCDLCGNHAMNNHDIETVDGTLIQCYDCHVNMTILDTHMECETCGTLDITDDLILSDEQERNCVGCSPVKE